MSISFILQSSRRHFPLLLVLITGTALSSLMFKTKQEAVSERQRAVFAETAHDHARDFRWELEAHLDVAQLVGDFVKAVPTGEGRSFEAFARAALERAPAIESLQWVSVVPPEEFAALPVGTSQDAMEGLGSFIISEVGDESGDPAETYLLVRYVVSRRGEAGLTCFHQVSDDVLREALMHASESRAFVVSKPIELLGDTSGEPVILLIDPFFEDGDGRLEGFVVAPLDIHGLCREAFRYKDPAKIQVRLMDWTSEAPLVIYSTATEDGTEAKSRLEAPFFVGGRSWELVLEADRMALAPGGQLEIWGILAGGLIFTAFVGIWIRQRQDYLLAVEQKVDERTTALSRINAELNIEMEQRREAEAGLRYSEERFREAFLHAPIGIGLLSPQGKWIHVNDALIQMTGFDEAELCERTFADMLPAEDAHKELARMGQMLAGDIRTFALEQRFRHKSESFKWALISISQVRSEDDRLLYFICQAIDIDERKQALEETRRAKEFSENIIKSSNDGIFAFDMEGKVTVWNAVMEQMTGLSWAEALGCAVTDVLSFLSETEDERPFDRVLSGGTVLEEQRSFTIPGSGRIGYCSGNYAPLHDGSGGITGGVAVLRDITEQRHARERLEAFAELLKKSNRELQDFAYVASHDLQEPLRKIRAFGDRLAARCGEEIDEQAKDCLSRMQDAARRMQTLINDLLSFSRITTRAHPFVQINLNEIVREVVSDLETKIEDTNAKIEIDSLPEIQADATQMRQLFQNLIGNALTYYRKDSAPHIRIYATEHDRESGLPPIEGPGCLILVKDNGIGFDEKYLDRIFSVFQRLHGRNEYPGTGVGLAICRKIAERHHGWITAKSVAGEGSTFITALPYKQNCKD